MSHQHDHDLLGGPALVAETGRDKAAEPTDPYQATAVRLSTPGHDGMAAMARAIVEEFVLLGWSRKRVMSIFTTPTFAGAHAVYLERGDGYVQALITEVMGEPEEEASDG